MSFLIALTPTGLFATDKHVFVLDFGKVGFRDGALYRMDAYSLRMEKLKFTGILWDPTSLVKIGNYIFIADRRQIWKVNLNTMSMVKHIPTKRFLQKVFLLGDMTYFKNKLFVSDIFGNAVFKFNLTGQIRKIFELRRANGLAVDSLGNLYVVTFTSPASIYMWDGDTLKKIHTSSLVRSGYDVEYLDGKLYITGYLSNNIVIYDVRKGEEREIYKFEDHPADLEIWNDYIFVSFPDARKVERLKLVK